jgi:hypothetical protein
MKMLTIVPVDIPKSFGDVKFTQAEYAAVKKTGPQVVPAITAMEALRNGKGVYRIKSEKQTFEIEIKGLKDPDEMDNSELFAEMASHGKPPRKQMARAAAVKFVGDLREKAAAMIVDDE